MAGKSQGTPALPAMSGSRETSEIVRLPNQAVAISR
jgi:hypothetical protein